MANVRPKKRTNINVDNIYEESRANPVETEGPPMSYFSEYDGMHKNLFDANTASKSIPAAPKVDALESLVAKLASLQFIVKGKIDADGKTELIFCSPEPVVTTVTNPIEELLQPKTVRFEDGRNDSKYREQHSRRSRSNDRHRPRRRSILF
jgi:hypothetical protein